MFQLSWLRSKWLLGLWFLTMNVLFFLPGSAFPSQNWLAAIYFDKWVHIGLFAGLLFLAGQVFALRPGWRTMLGWLMATLAYGYGVELIQKYFVANRSFDLTDIVADMAGAALGIWLSARLNKQRVIEKNKPL